MNWVILTEEATGHLDKAENRASSFASTALSELQCVYKMRSQLDASEQDNELGWGSSKLAEKYW